MKELTSQEAMRRLSSVQLGRVVFTAQAMPAIRPVNHLVDDGQVIIRSHEGSAIVTAARADQGTVVAYEADDIDLVARTGWSVVIIGLARLVGETEQAARYRRILQPWVTGEMGYVIRIDPQMVTGFELIPDEPSRYLTNPPASQTNPHKRSHEAGQRQQWKPPERVHPRFPRPWT